MAKRKTQAPKAKVEKSAAKSEDVNEKDYADDPLAVATQVAELEKARETTQMPVEQHVE